MFSPIILSLESFSSKRNIHHFEFEIQSILKIIFRETPIIHSAQTHQKFSLLPSLIKLEIVPCFDRTSAELLWTIELPTSDGERIIHNLPPYVHSSFGMNENSNKFRTGKYFIHYSFDIHWLIFIRSRWMCHARIRLGCHFKFGTGIFQ